MELELWSEMSAAISGVATDWPRRPRDRYSTAAVVRVHQWACLHDRPVCWACEPGNWPPAVRPGELPDQSTMSRRTRRDDFMQFLRRVGGRLNGKPEPALVKVVDGKPLELPNHSGDPDAAWGRGVSRTAIGYKIHAIWSGNPMPDALAITSLDVCEKRMAARLIGRVRGGGYLLGDGHYDASWLFDYCHHHCHQLVCPRAKPGTGEGHHYVGSPLRVAAPPQVHRDAGGARGGQRLRARVVRPADRHRARLLTTDLFRRRPRPAAELGPTHLAGPQLGHGQVAGQRLPYPHQPPEGCLMHNPLRERVGVRVSY